MLGYIARKVDELLKSLFFSLRFFLRFVFSILSTEMMLNSHRSYIVAILFRRSFVSRPVEEKFLVAVICDF